METENQGRKNKKKLMPVEGQKSLGNFIERRKKDQNNS